MVTSGTRFAGRYKIEEQIASGGMGTIYRATDERLNRTVAIKLLRHDLARDARFIERFRREARSAASLSHANVAAVYDYAEDGDNHGIVMDFVDGHDLARVIRENGPLEPRRALTICAQICDALGHAHKRGVVHRDIKPGNVMVAHDGQVKVTDFGIARAAGESTLTATGSVLGTAHYISPEQANGQAASEASDIYSLGIVLYEMLTGSVPFTGDSAVAIAMRHLREEVPPPSRLNASVDADADRIVEGATRKNPAERYPSAEAMAADARASFERPADDVTAVLPVTTSSAATRPIPTRGPLRRAAIVAAAALAGLALIAAALVVARADDTTPRARRERAGQSPAEAVEASATTPLASGTVLVPEIVGQPKPVAEAMLKEAGLKAEFLEGASSDDYPKDVVYASDPAPGEAAQEGDTITLFLGTAEVDDEDDEDDDEKGPPGHAKDKEHKD